MIDDTYHNDQKPSSNELGFEQPPRWKVKPTRHTRTKASWLGFQQHLFQSKPLDELGRFRSKSLTHMNPQLGFRGQDKTQGTIMKPYHQIINKLRFEPLWRVPWWGLVELNLKDQSNRVLHSLWSDDYPNQTYRVSSIQKTLALQAKNFESKMINY